MNGRKSINAISDVSCVSSGQDFGLRSLHTYQKQADEFLQRSNDLGILGMVPGTGKTIVAIRRALEHDGPKLVICRRDDFLTWRIELGKEGVSSDSIICMEHSKDVQQVYVFDDYTWVLLTYDMFRNESVYEFVQAVAWSIVIADECHQIKRWKAARTKAVYRATRHIPRRISMTGSPITNEASDVFAHALFIDNGRRFGKSEWLFMNRYYLKSGKGWYQRRSTKQEITRKLDDLLFYVGDEVIPGLPTARRVIKGAAMSSRQAKAYEKVVTDWEIEIEEGDPTQVLEINHVTVQLQKLRQIASGFFYDEQKVSHRLPCTKLDLLFDMLSDNEYLGLKPKIVIWCSFTDEILRIAEQSLGHSIKYEILYGKMSTGERESARQMFRDDPSVRLFIGQVDAGVGMNELVVADTAVYFSNSYRVVSKDQSMRRIRRIGSERHDLVTYWELISEGTVDEKIIHSVSNAMSYASSILRALKNGKPLRSLVT